MALDFPSSPALGATYSSGGSVWRWDGAKWAQTALASNPLIVAPPLAANWTKQNFIGTTTLTDVANGVALYAQSATSGITNILRAATIPAPATPYTLDMNFSVIASAGGSGNYIKAGAVWFDGTKAQMIFAGALASTLAFSVENYTNLNSFSGVAAALTCGATLYNTQSFWIRLADNGANISISYSSDAISWLLLYGFAKASGYLGASGYTNVGIAVNEQVLGQNGQIIATLLSWRVH